jgi:hypothetical protein
MCVAAGRLQGASGGGGAEAKALFITLARAGCQFGAEGSRKAKSLFERNTTLTWLNLACERVTCVEGGRVWTERSCFVFLFDA